MRFQNAAVSKALVGITLASLMLVGAANAETKNSVRQVWSGVISSADQLPQWVEQLSGIITPDGTVVAEGAAYRVLNICQAKNAQCKETFLQLAVNAQVTDAWGAFVTAANSNAPNYQWINNPQSGVKTMLQQQAEKNIKLKNKQ